MSNVDRANNVPAANASDKDGNMATGPAEQFYDTDAKDAGEDTEGSSGINNFGDEIETEETGSGTMGSSAQ